MIYFNLLMQEETVDKQKRAICEKDANSSYENSDTVFARAKLGYCSVEIIAWCSLLVNPVSVVGCYP